MKIPPYYSQLEVISPEGESKTLIVRGKGNRVDFGKAESYNLDKLLQAGVSLAEVQTSLFQPRSIEAENNRLQQAVIILQKLNKLSTPKTEN